MARPRSPGHAKKTAQKKLSFLYGKSAPKRARYDLLQAGRNGFYLFRTPPSKMRTVSPLRRSSCKGSRSSRSRLLSFRPGTSNVHQILAFSLYRFSPRRATDSARFPRSRSHFCARRFRLYHTTVRPPRAIGYSFFIKGSPIFRLAHGFAAAAFPSDSPHEAASPLISAAGVPADGPANFFRPRKKTGSSAGLRLIYPFCQSKKPSPL